MKISADEVRYIAKLAKLRFNDEEINKLTEEFESILTHFQSIDRMDLKKVDLNRLSEGQELVARADANTCFNDKEKLFRNVKSMGGSYVQVPRIIEG
jgi:aspartyl-tRNA(Asn)/glutamyl-tRNA(Gln) amidotransferase subunit C